MATITETFANAVQHHQAGRLQEAEQIYRQILAVEPNQPDAWHRLGMACIQLGKHQEAVECIRRALALRPNWAEAHYHLGIAFNSQGNLEDAIACYRQLLALRPDLAVAHNNLGNAFSAQGKLDEAIACYRRALELKSDYAEAFNNLGNAFKEQGKLDEVIACYRQAVALKPDLAEAHYNLGNIFSEQGKLDEAIACYRRALELKSDHADAHYNLGNAYKEQGKLDEAIACCRTALRIDPGFVSAHDNLLFMLQYHPGYNRAAIFAETERWNELHAAPLGKFIQRYGNERSPARRLRVGYVSPNFRDHCQAFFMMPLLSAHDHQHFEIFCYAAVVLPDTITSRLRACADAWRNIVGLSDEQVAELVRADGIDILVDLTMHMGPRNHLLVFSRKPAPIQVCWLAYPGTTGLGTIDYRLTDPYLDPPGLDDRHYSETTVRLPDSFWCYDPLTSDIEVNPLPASANGYVTFGCLNTFCKVNAGVVALWSKVLHAVTGSRLLLLAPEGSHRQELLLQFQRQGVSPGRIHFVSFQPRLDYLHLYHAIDIGLDTFPYNGHTTSLDSYWMGVPVITLVSGTIVGRAGLSQAQNLGLPEIVARSPDEFVALACAMAADQDRLAKLRALLRGRLRNSPLMDASRFARNMETAYRSMWQRWCGVPTPADGVLC